MTPIALFAYNRPDHLRRALESLARCDRLDECRLHIFCDGAKNPRGAEAVEATRRVAREWAPRLNAEVIEREANLGLARSIAGTVTELCDRHGRVIVVEDDLVVSADFIDYMLQALDRYQDAEDVYQVSGYMFPVAHPEAPDAFLMPLTTTWGWATWKRAWDAFDWHATGAWKALSSRNARRKFDLGGAYGYTDILRDRLAGDNDSWGILWWWSVYRAGGLAVHPRRSLVWVGGFDGSGTHCDDLDTLGQAAAGERGDRVFETPIRWPLGMAADLRALGRVTASLKWMKWRRRFRYWLRRCSISC
ncbi:MAG: glycosyltransferase [Nitrospirae bacterium]|nr:glycosyltransferase [Nitrospirota bacterium]